MIELTEELSLALKAKYNPDGSNLRQAQIRMTKMLAFIDDICTKNNLSYWLDSGTLLGAVRHGGFIPWDDDTDIVMPVKDYRKFRKIMLRNKPSDSFLLQCQKTDNGYFALWPTLVDKKSEYVWNSNIHKFRTYRGLQVDIFLATNIYNKKVDNFILKFHRDMVDRALDIGKPLFFVKFNQFISKCMSHVAYIFGSIFDRHDDKYYQIYGSYFTRNVYDLKDVFPLKRIMFEGVELNAPYNTDVYLTNAYGPDYMKIPEEENRQVHSVDIIMHD